MTARLIPALSLSCGAFGTLYMGLMIATIFFATWQTQAVSSVRDTESAIANLETNYYSTMNRISEINPSTVGFVQPAQVEYVAETKNTSATLTFAGN
jgi:hypothetical protein